MSPYCLILPFRDRDAHLYRFVIHYNDLLPDVPIFVIEQNDDKPFNRAKLFNVGFLEEGHKYSYAVYHDVDMYLNTDMCSVYEMFAYPAIPTHLGVYLQQFNHDNRNKPEKWRESYSTFFGGVCAISKEHMEAFGGLSNEIWGYGYEDDECRQNIHRKGLETQRRKAYFWCEDHKRELFPDHMKKNAAYLLAGRNDSIDGLSHCEYELVSREEKTGYTLIKVNL